GVFCWLARQNLTIRGVRVGLEKRNVREQISPYFCFPSSGLSTMKCSEFRTDWFQAMYKGDILPAEAHERLVKNPQAVLIDVRTEPEWAFVGVPAVDRLIRLSWQAYPQMQVNADF